MLQVTWCWAVAMIQHPCNNVWRTHKEANKDVNKSALDIWWFKFNQMNCGHFYISFHFQRILAQTLALFCCLLYGVASPAWTAWLGWGEAGISSDVFLCSPLLSYQSRPFQGPPAGEKNTISGLFLSLSARKPKYLCFDSRIQRRGICKINEKML